MPNTSFGLGTKVVLKPHETIHDRYAVFGIRPETPYEIIELNANGQVVLETGVSADPSDLETAEHAINRALSLLENTYFTVTEAADEIGLSSVRLRQMTRQVAAAPHEYKLDGQCPAVLNIFGRQLIRRDIETLYELLRIREKDRTQRNAQDVPVDSGDQIGTPEVARMKKAAIARAWLNDQAAERGAKNPEMQSFIDVVLFIRLHKIQALLDDHEMQNHRTHDAAGQAIALLKELKSIPTSSLNQLIGEADLVSEYSKLTLALAAGYSIETTHPKRALASKILQLFRPGTG